MHFKIIVHGMDSYILFVKCQISPKKEKNSARRHVENGFIYVCDLYKP